MLSWVIQTICDYLFIRNSSQSSILKILKNSFKLLLFPKRCSQILYLKYDNVYLLWPPQEETLFDLLCLPIAIPCALTLIILFAWRIKTCLYATLSVLSIQISLSLILASSKGHSAWNKRLFALVVSLWPSPPHSPYITKTNRIYFYGSTRLSKICSKRILVKDLRKISQPKNLKNRMLNCIVQRFLLQWKKLLPIPFFSKRTLVLDCFWASCFFAVIFCPTQLSRVMVLN